MAWINPIDGVLTEVANGVPWPDIGESVPLVYLSSATMDWDEIMGAPFMDLEDGLYQYFQALLYNFHGVMVAFRV